MPEDGANGLGNCILANNCIGFEQISDRFSVSYLSLVNSQGNGLFFPTLGCE